MQSNLIIGSNETGGESATQRAIGDVQAMQLASITYCTLTNNVASTFAHYFPTWQLVWQPVQIINGNYAFIAYNGAQYVIAIRGSILNFSWGAFDNWFEQDFNLLFQQPFAYTMNPSAKPMISQGAFDGLNDLIALKNQQGQTMWDYLKQNAMPNRKLLCVTGHSLGGNLATVYAMYLRYQILQAGFSLPGIFSVLTFAAPTSWNIAFASEFDSALTNTWRYYGMLDIVPFSACNVIGLRNLYPPPTPAATTIYVTYKNKRVYLSEVFETIQLAIAASEIVNKSVYGQVNQQRGSIELNTAGQQYSTTYTDPLLMWFDQASNQHDHNHYLDWLGSGADEITCQ